MPTKLAFRTAAGAGANGDLGTVDVSPFANIRVVADERGTSPRCRRFEIDDARHARAPRCVRQPRNRAVVKRAGWRLTFRRPGASMGVIEIATPINCRDL